ncbi:MAG: RHS repeat-associated core domain-containing protein [Pseudomonadota bacterium]
MNRLSTTIAPDSGLTSYSYDAVGNRASVTYPNGTTAAYTYDSLNRLTLLENRKSGGELISSYNYTLGPAGNRLSVAEQSGRTVNYTYDALYRLTQEAIADPALGNETIGYTYDDFGNRLTKTDASGTISYTYDANDRMLSEAGPTSIATYTYDDNGNTLSKTEGLDTTLYSYDFENRLVGVNSAAGAIAYGYDSDGIRVAKSTGAVITRYLVDKNRDYAQVLEETDNGSLTVSYVYGDDLISQNRGSSYYYLYDGQMSTRQLVDNSEAVLNEYTYDAFGIILGQAGVVANNYMYTGEQYDPNAGFYYLRARYYNQNVGRFITSDMFEGLENDPLTLHKYLYANGNPVMNLDSSGYLSTSLAETLTVMGISHALTSMIVPNLAMLKTYSGRTNQFEIYIAGGGELGYLLYFSFFDAYIVEKNPAGRGEILYPKKRGLFHVTLFGFGVGTGAILPSSDPQSFSTNTRRNLEHFEGAGRISSIGASVSVFGLSCGEAQMAEGTRIPFNWSLGPTLSFERVGASAFVAQAYWDLIHIDYI